MTPQLHSNVDTSTSPRQRDASNHTILNCVHRLSWSIWNAPWKPPFWRWWPRSSVVGKNDGSLQKTPVKEEQLSWSKVRMKALVGEDAILLSTQMLCYLMWVNWLIPSQYHLELELFSNPTFSPCKPSKIILCIHSAQACCSLVCRTVSFTTASLYRLSMWLKIYIDYFC